MSIAGKELCHLKREIPTSVSRVNGVKIDSYWETELWVKTMDPTTKEPKVESKFITRVSRATVETSMEDVAYNAFVFYHGLRSDKTLKGALRHFPYFILDFTNHSGTGS
jgi:hypothetical protein